MRVLHISPITTSVPSGLSIYVIDLIKAVSRIEGVQVGLLPSSRDVNNFSIDGVSILSPLKTRHWNPWYVNKNYFNDMLKSFGCPDVVHFHGVYHPFHAAFSIQLKRYGIPYICAMHGGLQQHSQRRKPLKKFLGNLLFFNYFIRNSFAIHALNDAEVSAIEERFPGKRFLVLPNGVPASLPERSLKKSAGRITFGFLGRIDVSHKGLDFLLKAVNKIQKEHPQNKLHFIFAGPFFGRKNEKMFWDLVNALPDPDVIEYKGIVSGEEKDKMFDLFDVFVHTSRHEGMPGAVLEAMARGIPCLVTPGTNVQKMVLSCTGGWGCSLSVDSIAQVVLAILREDFAILKKGVTARKYVLDHLTWSQIARQYVYELKKLLGEQIKHV